MNKQESTKKIRVYEYAKQMNMSSKEIITILKRMNMPVNNHMSVMEEGMTKSVEKFFHDVKAKAAAKMVPSSKSNTGNERAGQTVGRSSSQGKSEKSEVETRRSGGQPVKKNRSSTEQVKYRNGAGQGFSGNQDNKQGSNRMRNQVKPNATGFTREGNRNAKSQSGRSPQGQSFSSPGHTTFSQQQQGNGMGQGTKDGKGRGNFGHSGHGEKRKDFNHSRYQDHRNFKSGKGRGNKNRKNNAYPPREKIDNTPKKVIVRGSMTGGELAKLLHKDASEVIKKLLMMGVMATINQELDLDTVLLLIGEYQIDVEVKIPVEDTEFETIEEKDDPANLSPRPPVVTIMGHVDHGKTTLLDAIRETKVASGEAGGITQHIGAYQVDVNGKKITFLDTPGHEAFTTMRARGAQVTDITVLVVAADDGVMPQTVEAIAHAKAASVPIIVAVNKIDKPGADINRIKTELTEHGLVQEQWGGDTIFVEMSAKQRTNLDTLLEMILLLADVNDYRANPNKRARGTIMEAKLDKGKGPVARLLVQHGTLKVGDAFVAGDAFGRIRAMTNDRGRRVKQAGPSTPIEITGLDEVPQAGDPFMAFENERKAREIAEKRTNKTRQSHIKQNQNITLEDLFSKIKDGEMKELNVILKADVQGSLEALKGSLSKIEVEGVRVNAIHSGVGTITESDIVLAAASSAIVVGFNVRPEPRAQLTAEQEKVEIRSYSIIYKVIEEIEQAMKGMLDPIYEEKIIGHAEVRETFKVSKIGTIAGCMIMDGKMMRSAQARVIRAESVLYTGKIDSLKRYKDDVKEVAEGHECGITLLKFNEIKVNDVIEAFIMEVVER